MGTIKVRHRSEAVGGGIRRTGVVEWIGAGGTHKSVELWFETGKLPAYAAEDDAETFLLALLMRAMRDGHDLHVEGFASRELLSNLTEWRDIWHHWLPKRYAPVSFSVDRVIGSSVRSAEGAVTAFSGGVDATFTVWRHTRAMVSYRSRPVTRGMMVHGFDIPLVEEVTFQRAFGKAARTLDSLGVPLVPVWTNFREVIGGNWAHVHGSALVACLQLFKGTCATGLIGSGSPYSVLVTGWGSTPMTDPLLASGSFEIVHDGATHDRTMKVREVAQWPEGRDALRVCWQGAALDRNCGSCEKCLRTMLNFRANGLPVPVCFPNVDLLHLVRTVVVKKGAAVRQFSSIVQAARRNGVDEPWVRVLDHRLEVIERKERVLRVIPMPLRAMKNRVYRLGSRIAHVGH